MLGFLRLVNLDAWRGVVDEERRTKARRSFELRTGEAGLSVYLAPSEAEQPLIVAAIACLRFNNTRDPLEPQNHVDLLPIDVEVVERFGVVEQTPGETPLPRANALHRELRWKQERLWELAEYSFSTLRVQAQRFDKKRLRAILAELDPHEVDEEKPEVRAWLAQFRGARLLTGSASAGRGKEAGTPHEHR